MSVASTMVPPHMIQPWASNISFWESNTCYVVMADDADEDDGAVAARLPT